jgi:PAS domain S-box-containing protein
MPQPLKVLIAEDNPADAELIVRELRRAGFEPDWQRVDSEAEFLARLHEGFDLVLSDYAMPQFSGLTALELLKRSGLEVPFIIVSGTIGEDLAAAVMKVGAADYLLKDRLARLGAAVTHALGESRLRREKRKADEALRLAHGQLRQLLEQSPAVLYVLKLDGDKVVPHLVSENITALLGFTVSETMSYEWWLTQLHPDDRALAVQGVADTIAAGASRTEYRLRHKEGHYCWVDDARRLICNAAGAPVELIGVWTDITERRRAEDIMRQASGRIIKNRRKKACIELAILAAVTASIYTLATVFDWFEGVTTWFLAHKVEEMDEIILTAIFIAVGLTVFAFRRWRESESELTSRHQAQTALGMLHGELDRRVKQRTAELDQVNQTLRTEITERKQTEAALRQSEVRFRELAENIQEVFWITDSQKNLMLYVSPAYEKVWGRTCQSLYESPSTWFEAIRPEDRERISKARLTGQGSGTYDEEFCINRPDGSQRWIRDRAFPVRDASGAVQRVVGVSEDITERKKLHEQFLHAQRLESLGMLASGVAHDLNNVLAPIVFAAPLLRDSLSTERDLKVLAMLERSAERGSGLVKQILGFARGTTGELRLTQVKHLARDIVEMIQETFPKSIQFEPQIPSDLWSVLGNPTQIHQVLLNLCVNARDAMPLGGKLRFSVMNRRLNAEQAADLPGARPGAWLLLEVADTGTGIPPDVLAHIWEPFFTTKGVGKGTGLGLSTVRGITADHHGFVAVDTLAGHGTTFRIYLPATPDESTPADGAITGMPPMGHGELILVVDDDTAVRDSVSAVLSKQDYRVLEARDGVEALNHLTQHGNEIALVITDVDMPLLDGAALVRIVAQLRPDLPLIVMSGHAADASNAAALTTAKKSAHDFLLKPFPAETLLATVHKFLQPKTKT